MLMAHTHISLGSGIPYPVPWRRMPANIVLNIQLIATILWMPAIAEKRAFLKSKGLNDPINFFQIYRPDAPWLSQTMIGAALPVDVVPQNVTCTGPMTLSLATVAEQDKGLAEWITKSPTVLVSLGSAYQYTESHAMTMAQALAKVLGDTKVQVLWKFNKKSGDYGDEFMSALQPFVESGRARVERWLQADPPSLLDSGHIVASVHHGGSGCYHEAVG
jgi:hypothetical protein